MLEGAFNVLEGAFNVLEGVLPALVPVALPPEMRLVLVEGREIEDAAGLDALDDAGRPIPLAAGALVVVVVVLVTVIFGTAVREAVVPLAVLEDGLGSCLEVLGLTARDVDGAPALDDDDAPALEGDDGPALEEDDAPALDVDGAANLDDDDDTALVLLRTLGMAPLLFGGAMHCCGTFSFT